MSIAFFMVNSGIDQAQLPPDFATQISSYQEQLQQFIESTKQTTQVQWQYQVPELGEGGSCSLFDQLSSTPYDLAARLGGQTADNLRLLQQVTALVKFYQQQSGSQWFGVYKKIDQKIDHTDTGSDGNAVLVKLAYFGAASRAEFPLTPEFAAISNNSTVGISGKGRIINNVSAYLATGGEYYTCDPKVQAEACLPILAADGRVLGIIDSEAFTQNIFTGAELALLVAVATSLSSILS
ncbi:GAF domain-containing protein [Undibacterium sp. Xuan67W]|uniref:GAF domain-containing protein n=1 Tax=Undibacterium sp. Xuan67W TaxID=3413057 RepID=UPI003BF42762